MRDLHHWRLLRAIQPEDALLLAWFVVVEPFAGRLLGTALAASRGETPGLFSWAAGTFCYLAALCALACLATRTAGAPTLVEPNGGLDMTTPSSYARLPMIVVLGIMLNTAGRLTGLDRGDACFGIAMLIWFAGLLLQSRLPQVPAIARRLLMSPAVVFAAWFYTDTVGDVLSTLDLSAVLAAYGTPEWGMASFELTMLFVVTSFSYLMFVFAPRQVAGAGGSWFQWFARYALYLLGVVLNLGPLQFVG